MTDYERCGAQLAPADAHPEKCELPEGHEGDHMIRSPGAVTMFPDEVADHDDRDE